MAFFQSLSKRLVLRIAACMLVMSLISTLALFARHSLRRTRAITRPAVHYPPFHNPEQLHHPNPKFKAAYVTMTKGDAGSLANLRTTIRQLEDRLNDRLHYPYIIFSNEALSTEFKTLTRALTSSDVAFYDNLDGSSYYGYGMTTNLTLAAEARERMNGSTLFGDSEDYRFASRFMAGMIFRHPALQDIDYYWRFETGTEYMCPIAFDPFQYMHDHGKKVSFSIALYEYGDTIPTLFESIMSFASRHPDWVHSTANDKSLWRFVLDDQQAFNMCHFWSNFQIADLSFFRSEAYQAYFDHLDHANGFFYERWGDPIVLSMAAVLFLEKDQVHFWDDIGYRVAGYFTHCPPDYSQCSCRPQENFDNDGYSCLSRF